MCVNLQSGPQRIIGFGQTAPNLLKDTASILDSPLLLWKISSSLPRCGSSSSRIGGSRAADYLGCWSPESLLPAFQQLLPARESRRATRQHPSPLPRLPFRQSHQISTFLNRGTSHPHPLQLVSRSFSNSHSFGLDPHNQIWGPDCHPPNSIRSHRTIFHWGWWWGLS